MTASPPKSRCCAPQRIGQDAREPIHYPVKTRIPKDAVSISEAVGLLGTNFPQILADEEGPLRQKALKPFQISPTTVTNKEFQKFVEETKYITDAERFGWSFVFWHNVPEHLHHSPSMAGAEWWCRVEGANWKDINGPGTRQSAWHEDHPVVHVSWNDAKAYASWVGGRLPTEIEWETAARAGLGDVPFPWGADEPTDEGPFRCNIWQGSFPQFNAATDGWAATAPASAYAPNGYGLYNMVGNVWEWTADPYRLRSLKKITRHQRAAFRGYKILKGGSFLCHKSYCYRYRIAARIGNSPVSTTSHQGFRVVWPS